MGVALLVVGGAWCCCHGALGSLDGTPTKKHTFSLATDEKVVIYYLEAQVMKAGYEMGDQMEEQMEGGGRGGGRA